MSRRLALLVNPAASGGAAIKVADAAAAALSELGADLEVVNTESADHARSAARDSVRSGRAVAAVGGDGFIGCLAGAISDADGVLAIIPAGRGNDLARVLGVPSDPEAAARLAATGSERPIDVAEANGRPFVGIASLGFDSDANRIANDAKLVRGNLVYFYAALRALAAWRDATFTVEIDGRRERTTGYSVAVANSKAYGGGMYLVPHAELDDGRLEVMFTGSNSKLHFLRTMPKVFKGTHVNDPSVRFLSGERITIDADRPFTVYADGDPIAELPVEIRIRPRPLRVVAPAE